MAWNVSSMAIEGIDGALSELISDILARNPRRRKQLSANKPQYDEHDQDGAENPAEARHAEVAMSIIAASAAENQDQNDDKKK